MKRKSKRWALWTLGALAMLLAAEMALVYVLDPFLHYRVPTLYNFRVLNANYVNPGLIAHTEYDALVVGSSMVECTEVSAIDEQFGLSTIKIATKAGNALHHSRTLENAFKTHELQAVFYGADTYAFDFSGLPYGDSWPEYLWNDSTWDDYQYLINWDVMTNDLSYALRQLVAQDAPKLSRDDWYWWEPQTFSRAHVLQNFAWKSPKKMQDPDALTPRFQGNIDAYVVPFIEAHPETEFYFYFPSYSQMFWVYVLEEGILENHLRIRQLLAETLLGYENVHLYDFSAKADWVLDLDRYTDYSHHLPEMNQETFTLIHQGEERITEVAQVIAHNDWLREKAYEVER